MTRRLSDRALWWLFNVAAFALTFAAVAIRSLWEMPT